MNVPFHTNALIFLVVLLLCTMAVRTAAQQTLIENPLMQTTICSLAPNVHWNTHSVPLAFLTTGPPTFHHKSEDTV